MRRCLVMVVLLMSCGPNPTREDDAGGAFDAGAPDASLPQADSAPRFSPTELVFSGVKGTTSAPRIVTISNRGEGPLTAPLELTGAPDFTLSPRSLRLDGGDSMEISVRFSPDAGALGVRSARVAFGDAGLALWGLATNGEQGANEPPLQSCLDALGFAIDAGSAKLIIGTSPNPVGDEVLQPMFHRADAGPVIVRPIARYSPNETLPFGWYTPLPDGGVTLHPVGTIALGQEQTLNPMLVPDSGSAFDPGAAPFGLYVHSNTFGRDTFTEDRRNTGPTAHAVRVYPAKTRDGTPLPATFVLAFEDAANGDYQDYVFVLANAGP